MTAEQQRQLKEEKADGPDSRRTAEPRQDDLGDDRLHLKQEEGAYKDGECVEKHGAPKGLGLSSQTSR
jgi:hypothetical protein